MNVTLSRISPVKVELSVEVPADTVKAQVERAYSDLGRRAKIRGFRPGKAPRNVLVQLFEPQVKNDVANALVNDTLPGALSGQNIIPVSTPNVEAGNLDATGTFAYKATFEVSPEVESVKYENLELKRPKRDVSDKLVDEQLEGLRKQSATLKAPEAARAAKAEDTLTIDFTLDVDGKKIEDGGAEGVSVELGSKQVLPELDEALLGKKVGDTLDVDATFPDSHPRTDFRSKKGTFHVKVVEVKERVLPTLDDEFAKDTGLGQTVVELRAAVHSRLEKALKDQSDLAVAEQIVEALNDQNPLDVPPSLVDQQTRLMEQEVIQTARRLGQRLTQEGFNSMRDRIRADAERKVRAGLLMAGIAKKLELKVTDTDLEEGIKELAEESGKNVAKLRAEYREKSKRDMLVGMILEDKILDLIEQKAKITEVDAEEFQKEREAKAAKAAEGPGEEPKAKKTGKKAEK